MPTENENEPADIEAAELESFAAVADELKHLAWYPADLRLPNARHLRRICRGNLEHAAALVHHAVATRAIWREWSWPGMQELHGSMFAPPGAEAREQQRCGLCDGSGITFSAPESNGRASRCECERGRFVPEAEIEALNRFDPAAPIVPVKPREWPRRVRSKPTPAPVEEIPQLPKIPITPEDVERELERIRTARKEKNPDGENS